jgi:hypothetical protein
MKVFKKPLAVAITGAVLAVAQPALASDQSPWLGAAGSGEVSAAYVSQSADRFYVGDTELDLPADLDLQTLSVGVSYAINDQLTIDGTFGYAESDFTAIPVLSPQASLSGLTDSKIGLRYSLYNADGAAVAVRGAVIIDGGYKTGSIAAIGDGGNGLELALLAGKSFDSGFAISGEAGYRTRDNDIPDEWFGNATGSYAFNDVFGAYIGYQLVRTNSKLDIGAPGFSPQRFPEVDEEYNLAYGGLNFDFSDNWGASLGYGKKFDGRNTAKSDFWNVAAVYSF